MKQARLKAYILMALVATLGVAMSFTGSTGNGHVVFQIGNYAGNRLLQLDTAWYTNALNQRFTVTKLKYYIGNIELLSTDGHGYQQKGYYLIDEEEPDSKMIPWQNIPEGSYTGMRFTLGVDSADNCTGLQSGALDPVHAMFWTWNTGYIFFKMEGKSPFSKSPGNIYEYHVGGFREPANSIRKVTLNFHQPLIVKAGHTDSVEIIANVLEVFQQPQAIDLASLSSVTDAYNAPMMADNYKDMFSIQGIKQ